MSRAPLFAFWLRPWASPPPPVMSSERAITAVPRQRLAPSLRAKCCTGMTRCSPAHTSTIPGHRR